MDRIDVSKWLFEHGYNRAIDSKEKVRLSELISEIVQLQNWVNDLQAGMYVNCVYCGHRYGAETEVPASMADVLKEHIEQCPEHPLFEARQEIERLETCNGGLRIQGKDFIKELEQSKKETEWLLNRITETYRYGYGQIQIKELKEEMQQALKEE